MNGSKHIAVIGLGYVGLPLALAFADAGFVVSGVDIRATHIALLKQGRNPLDKLEPELARLIAKHQNSGRVNLTTDHYEAVIGADAVFVCVATPIEKSGMARWIDLGNALAAIAPHVRDNALVSIESTLAPGIMYSLVVPILRNGRNPRPELAIVHAPERLTPGKLLSNLKYVPRVIGGVFPGDAEIAAPYYRAICKAPIYLTTAPVAEIVKTAENAYRDVQIAFVNELARLCEILGVDVFEARNLINTCPGRDLLLPGPGVGGHCLPKDGLLLLSSITDSAPSVIRAARQINDSMPALVFERIIDLMGEKSEKYRVALLGLAYKADSADTRNSPTRQVARLLANRYGDVIIHDPNIQGLDESLATILNGVDLAVIMVGHTEYKQADWPALVKRMRAPVIFDTRGTLKEVDLGGGVYHVLGNPRGTK